jgi:hypothetical protein
VNPKNFSGELKRRNVYKVAIRLRSGRMAAHADRQPFFEMPNWAIRPVFIGGPINSPR